jgi:hypothetical protein
MAQDQEMIRMDRAAELLFTDSSKNFSDLKSREWNATYLSVLAIMGLAVLVHGSTPAVSGSTPAISQWAATVLMFLIFFCHWITTWRCEKNLDVFRTRVKDLIRCHFPKESHDFFKKKDFGDALVDEGSISIILYGSTLITLVCGLVVVW